MGAWGTGAFENDIALDWQYDFIESGPRKGIRLTVSQLREDSGNEPYMNSECEQGFALVTTVAVMMGMPAPEDWTDELDAALRKWKFQPSSADIRDCLEVCARLLDPQAHANVKEVWAEETDSTEWNQGVLTARNFLLSVPLEKPRRGCLWF